MKRLLVIIVVALAACGGGGGTSAAKSAFATAKDAADAAGCGGFTDNGPEPSSSVTITLATDQGTCTLDGISLKFSVYASQADRQKAESTILLLGRSFLSNDAHLVAGSGANVIVDHGAKDAAQITPPDVEKVIRKVADKLHLGIMEVTGKAS